MSGWSGLGRKRLSTCAAAAVLPLGAVLVPLPAAYSQSLPDAASVEETTQMPPAEFDTPAGEETSPGEEGHDATSPKEAARVDNVPVHDLQWVPCMEDSAHTATVESFLRDRGLTDSVAPEDLECATHEVPLDYDEPNGTHIALNVTRLPAANPEERIGTLFTNPGGPGGPGIAIPSGATAFFGEDVLNRFDVVGIDPRAVGGSIMANCFDNPQEALDAINIRPNAPVRGDEERAMLDVGASVLAQACSRPENVIARHASTANTARDLDVMRRAVGDDKISYYGISYGSVLGQTYADMFPDRIRALAIDGIVDLPDWYGTNDNADENLFVRTQSAQATDDALVELLRRCDEAAVWQCPLSGLPGSSMDYYLRVKDSLANKPVVVPDPLGGPDNVVDDRVFAVLVASLLRDPMSVELIPTAVVAFWVLAQTGQSQDAAEFSEYLTETVERERALEVAAATETPENPSELDRILGELGRTIEAQRTIACVDVAWPDYESAVRQMNDQPDKLAGAHWGRIGVECSHPNWTVKDEDRFVGPMGARTTAPMLIVGNYWDPATHYQQAKKAAARIPNNYFLSSDNWGHGAATASDCAQDAIDAYLVSGEKPAVHECQAKQPFE